MTKLRVFGLIAMLLAAMPIAASAQHMGILFKALAAIAGKPREIDRRAIVSTQRVWSGASISW